MMITKVIEENGIKKLVEPDGTTIIDELADAEIEIGEIVILVEGGDE
jgi:hypothetical protein